MKFKGNNKDIDPKKELDEEVALKLHGYGKQGYLGDNKKDKPSLFKGFTVRNMWQAWKDLEGMSKNDARINLINLATPLL